MLFAPAHSMSLRRVANAVAPVLSGTVLIGNSLAIAPGTWFGSPVLTYTLRRDGVAVAGLIGVTEAAIEAYALVAADIGPSLTVLEIPNGDSFRGVSSNALIYSVAGDGDNLLWWKPTSNAPGDVSNWVDEIAGADLAEAVAANQPTYSATDIDGLYPGVRFVAASSDKLVDPTTAKTILTTRTQYTIIMAVHRNTALANRPLMEYGATGGNVAGGFSFMSGDGAANNLGAFVTAATICDRFYGTTMAATRVYTLIVDGTAAAAIAAIRENGVAQALAGVSVITPPHALNGTNSLALGNRVAGTLPGDLSIGDVIIRAGIATGNALSSAEHFVGFGVGQSW